MASTLLRSAFASSSGLTLRISRAAGVAVVTMSSTRTITSKEWREKHNRFKDRLCDMPDWSYTDGRGYGPPSVGQKKRYLRDQQLAETVVRRMKELNEAKKFK